MEDAEGKFIREGLRNIETIKEDIVKLQKTYLELSRRVDKIEFSGIKKQLDSLHNSLLETNKSLASVNIDHLTLLLEDYIRVQLSNSSMPTYAEAHEFLILNQSNAGKDVEHSTTPLSAPLSVFSKFEKECQKYFRKYHLRPYRD
jgi:hypothetical protein